MSPRSNSKKPEPKKTVCKEFDCSEPSRVAGYCRLHFMRVVKAHREESILEDSVDAEKSKRDRRKGSRFEGLPNSNADEAEPLIAAVESLGLLDTDITQIAVLDEVDALPPSKKDKKAA